MRYLFTLIRSREEAKRDLENPAALREGLKNLVAELKPEAVYMSTLRRAAFVVADVKDPHVQLRKAFTTLDGWGDVVIEPVSSLEEFFKYVEQM